ncbi:hypothetical protein PMAYCL1PPCAC_16888, partial [Pristionchus mayeri]
QACSMLGELWLSMGVPIFLLNHGVVYCAGFVPFQMSATLYACIFAALFFELCTAYLACMYYRRNVITRDNLVSKWKKIGFLTFIQFCSTCTLVAMYLLVERFQIYRESVTGDLEWLLVYPCVMFIIFNKYVIFLVVG